MKFPEPKSQLKEWHHLLRCNTDLIYNDVFNDYSGGKNTIQNEDIENFPRFLSYITEHTAGT